MSCLTTRPSRRPKHAWPVGVEDPAMRISCVPSAGSRSRRGFGDPLTLVVAGADAWVLTAAAIALRLGMGTSGSPLHFGWLLAINRRGPDPTGPDPAWL